nr:hypothetical protein [Streptomyces sp. FT05W]
MSPTAASSSSCLKPVRFGDRTRLIRRGLYLRVESGLLSGIDLGSDDPGTKMMVSVLAAVP